jgi:hypothetical protein
MTCAEWSLMVAPASGPDDTVSETLRRRALELRASKDIIDRTTKPCPKCQWNIEKNGGWCVVLTPTCCHHPSLTHSTAAT